MTGAEIRDASTVVLLRDSDAGPEVWLMTRVTGMAFAGGMAVFPGGRVDTADAGLPFAGGADEAARRFECTPEQARAIVGAAVREVFEETGVLLSVPTVDVSGARADVEAGRVSFGDLLRANEVAVDGAALHPWSRWVTPAGEVRRYDTRFFVAAMPDDAQAQDVTTESSSAGLVRCRRGARIGAARRDRDASADDRDVSVVERLRHGGRSFGRRRAALARAGASGGRARRRRRLPREAARRNSFRDPELAVSEMSDACGAIQRHGPGRQARFEPGAGPSAASGPGAGR